jgi:hypothetical protein
MPSKVVRAALALSLGAVVPLTWLATPAGAAVDGRELRMTFESTSLRANAGKSALDVGEVRSGGGSVAEAVGSNGVGTAARFPAYDASSPALAMLTVVDNQGADDLAPGAAAFRFGADFTLNPTSAGSSADNGNNLVQRGLFNSSMQYKLDLDKEHPGCRVKGDRGAVQVRAPWKVKSNTWYRLICERDGSSVSLTVQRLSDDRTWRYTGSGKIGELRADRRMRLSIGGKVNAAGKIMSGDSDQFNGRVDNVYLNIL